MYDYRLNWTPLSPVTITNTHFCDTRLIQTPCYYGQFSLSMVKALTFSSNSNKLIRTPDADKGHYFLAQLTNSHWKSTTVMPTLHNQLCIVINVSFLKAKKPSVDSMLMFPVLDYDELLTSILDYFGMKQVKQRRVLIKQYNYAHVHVDERFIECFQGFSPQNDSFVKVRHVSFDRAGVLFYPL